MRILAILEFGFSVKHAILRLFRLLADAGASCLTFCGLKVKNNFAPPRFSSFWSSLFLSLQPRLIVKLKNREMLSNPQNF